MTKRQSPRAKTYLEKSVDIAVHLFVIAAILFVGFQIIGPFVMPVAWGMIIAVSLRTPYDKLKSAVGGRDKLAGGLFILLGLAILIVPIWLTTESLVEGAVGIGDQLNEGTLSIPPPSERVREWPVIGESTYNTWHAASENLEATVVRLEPQLEALGGRLVGAVAGLGWAVLQTVFAIVIAGILLMHTESVERTLRATSAALGGERGSAMVDLATATIRSVVKGVLAVAVIQSLLALGGLVVADVPGAGFWALLVLIAATIQLPTLLVLGPIALWVFSAHESTAIAVLFLIWSLIVSFSDAGLKPLFLGRGVQVPMLVILIGAIGGMLRFGVVGLFVGAVILAIGYELVVAWMKDSGEVAEVGLEPS